MDPGDMLGQWDSSHNSVLRSVNALLARLATADTDILYRHDPNVSEIPDAAASVELRDRGVVRAVGIGPNFTDAVETLFRGADIKLAIFAGRYTLLGRRGADDLSEAASGRLPVDRRRQSVQVGVALHSATAIDVMHNYEPALAEVIARANRLADAAELNGASLPQVAIAFTCAPRCRVSLSVCGRPARFTNVWPTGKRRTRTWVAGLAFASFDLTSCSNASVAFVASAIPWH